VTGAESESDALKVGRSVATSPLVKTALAGGDPNWGRILAAAGRAGVDLEPERIYLWAMAEGVGEVPLVRAGIPAGVNQERAKRAFDSGELTLRLDLGMGEAGTTLWTCDLTQEYVRINAEYHT
jgi:glutamate N-acetyltransferase/amino-acid N-acetyltransferase